MWTTKKSEEKKEKYKIKQKDLTNTLFPTELPNSTSLVTLKCLFSSTEL